MEEYTFKLASFASSLEFDDLPSKVVDHAKLCLLDTLGCGLFGSTLPWSRILANCIVDVEPGGGCTLWGLAAKASPTAAALVNGSMVHGFELDDLHKQSIVHPGSVTTTAALAVAEFTGGVSGKRLLAAMVAGYEVGARVGMSLGTAHLLQGWHPTGTHGTLAAAAACGSVLGLPPDQMQHAFGIAGTQAAGLMASQYASMVKRFHAGRAAQSGVYGALLARRGYTGIAELFEYEYGGYCTTLSPSFDREKLVAGLGETWETGTVGFKPYSTNGSCHTVIDCLIELKRLHGFAPDDVEEVRVFTSTATKEHVGWPYVPDSVTTAQMNLPYIAAVAIATGDAFVDQFTEERIRDEKLVALSRRVVVIADPEIDARGPAHRHSIRIEARLKDGRILTGARRSAKGSADFPLTVDDVETKFERLAGMVLDGGSVRRLREMVYALDTLADASALGKALSSPTGS